MNEFEMIRHLEEWIEIYKRGNMTIEMINSFLIKSGLKLKKDKESVFIGQAKAEIKSLIAGLEKENYTERL
jgi:hypothetical protein